LDVGRVAGLQNSEQAVGGGSAKPDAHDSATPTTAGTVRMSSQDTEVPDGASREGGVHRPVVGADAGKRVGGQLSAEVVVRRCVPGRGRVPDGGRRTTLDRPYGSLMHSLVEQMPDEGGGEPRVEPLV